MSLTVVATAREASNGHTAVATAALSINLSTLVVSPIVLDLDGDGIHTTALAESTGQFDLLQDGTPVHSGWISAGDAFLAVDANGNGLIDDRGELFGGAVGEGFAKLAAFDDNGDGVVDARDTGFDRLLVWQDLNSNHQTDKGELRSLAAAGVASLNVGYWLNAETQHGNLLLERSVATGADGRSIQMVDALENGPIRRERLDCLDEPLP